MNDNYDGLNHGLCSRTGSVSTTTVLSLGIDDIRPFPPIGSTPINRLPKIVTGDYLGDPYCCAKFGGNPPMEASGQGEM